ncbi:MAG: hypothetical protein P3B98_04725 [Gemmatimonadota bacterium]|nr:hypothetical protein [Gemmatimonadota bacterium]
MTSRRSSAIVALAGALACLLTSPTRAGAQQKPLTPVQQLARDVYKELVEINTSV